MRGGGLITNVLFLHLFLISGGFSFGGGGSPPSCTSVMQVFTALK